MRLLFLTIAQGRGGLIVIARAFAVIVATLHAGGTMIRAPISAESQTACVALGTIASVQREMHTIFPASSLISIDHTCDVRPTCTGTPVAVTTPDDFGRR